MVKLKVIQASSNLRKFSGSGVNGYTRLLKRRIEPLHTRFCAIHGYKYEVEYSDRGIHPWWMKAYMMLIAIEEGFDRVVWLDADVVWLGEPLDPKFETVFGATYHEMFWHANHFNAGVLYVNCENAKPVIESWFAERVNNFNDQEVLNANLKQHVTAIGMEWNCQIWIPHYSVPNPKVVAWHGCPNRIGKMHAFISNLKKVR